MGDAGIGKTALLDAIAAEAGPRGFLIQRSRPAASESDLPFAGLHDLIATDLDAFATTLSRPLRRALDVVLFREDPPERGQGELAVDLAVLTVLRAMLDRAPLALVLDDVQWLDEPTRRVLAFVVPRLASHPLAVVAALRGVDEDVAAPVVPEPRTVIRVGPLSAAAIADVVAQRMGRVPSPVRAGELHRLSGGNPYLAVEIARAAASLPAGVADLPVPARFRSVLGARLSGLSDGCRRGLLAAALLSRPTVDVLDRFDSGRWLAEAEEGSVVRRRGRYVEFDHPLLAATCRELAGPAPVREVHAQLADAVVDAVERARHLALAVSGIDERVAAQVEAAAQEAGARADVTTAAELARHALLLTPEDALDDRARRAVAAAQWFAQAGASATARDCLDPVIAALPPGNGRAACLLALAEASGPNPQGALALLRDALAQPALDPRVEISARLAKSRNHLGNGELLLACTEASTALALARAGGYEDRVARAALAEAESGLLMGNRLEQSEAWAIAQNPRRDLVPVYEHADRAAAFAAFWSDDNAAGARLLERLITTSRELGDVYSEGALALHLAELEVRRGRLAEAADLAELGYRLGSDGEHHQFPHYVRAHVAAYRGDVATARTLATQGLATARASGDAIFSAQNLLVLGFVEVSCGDYVAGSAYGRELRDLLRRMQWRHPGCYRWHADAVEAFLGVNRVDEAADVTAELWEQADHLALRGCQAIAARCDGMIYAYRGDPKQAMDSLHQSLQLLDGLDVPMERARTLLALGIVRRRARQKASARQALAEALAIFTNIGCPLWTRRAEAELRRAGSASGEDELTVTERSVADLAAAGATNREIAAKLFLAPRTVETMLTRVYRKLRVRSRTELARRITGSPEG